MRGTILSGLLLAVTTLGGCYATGDVGYRATYSSGYSSGGGDVYVSTPDLVTVSPGVQVVADYDEPVFYTDGFYWRFYDNGWYRSNNYASGWYYYERPPTAVLRIDRPYAYAHYRPRGYVARNRPRYRPAQPIVRDHRSTVRAEPTVRSRAYQPPPAAAPARDVRPAPPPATVRDHRAAPAARETRETRERDPRDHRR